ncbi:MAG: manganese transporter [Hyphomonadaceae bacterium BRH_c29]|nr:MAG: manganese transporter [Hyphomonadaceae bacterium BRH_c29]
MKLPFGPGALVAAAFIGPGTVTACTLAGANFGYALIWALVFATLATIVLQDMSARLGIAGGMGLGEALVAPGTPVALKWLSIVLVLAALALGNAAYEAGNLSGGALGAGAAFGLPAASQRFVVWGLAALAAVVLLIGRYKVLERLLVGLVILMSLAFAGSLLLVRPDLSALIGGLRPNLPEGSLLTAIALIGTTIVPYNLFLHAASVREKWPEGGAEALRAASADTRVSIGLGGLISILILSTAAASLFGSGMMIQNAGDMAASLEPAYGPAARLMVGTGLFAAGLSSAVTAPIATAYAVCEVTGRAKQGKIFRGIALAVLAIGTIVASLGIKPVSLILIAQVANGFLLPIIAVFLIVTMNRRSILGDNVNGLWSNVLGGAVVIIAAGFGVRLIMRALGIWP